ncbi:MAG: hypothetical protein N2578_05725 [Bdellovibrionaceae bacterium]|nr:hypothetical protein [Pseudobdellovibrionaceae bacterium]
MPYEFYKVLHIVGILLLFTALAMAILLFWLAPEKSKGLPKTLVFTSHGLGAFLVFLSGFGLAARLGYASQLPPWVYVKVGIWLVVALSLSLIKRKAHMALLIYPLLILLGGGAAWLALTKPNIGL